MEPFLDGRVEFSRIDHQSFLELQPGDCLGLWLSRDIRGNRVRNNHTNHLGVYLGNGVFTHVLMHKKACFDRIATPPWQQRIRAAWRPLENPL